MLQQTASALSGITPDGAIVVFSRMLFGPLIYLARLYIWTSFIFSEELTMKRALVFALIASGCLVFAAANSNPQDDGEAFLGDIKLVACDYDHRGWLHCEGQVLSIIENQALFALLGTAYGGDGKTEFKLPDLRKAEEKLRSEAEVNGDSSYLRYIICVKGGRFPSHAETR